MLETRDPVRIARLDTDRVSLVLVCVGTHVPRLLHFGGRLPDGLDVPSLRRVLTAPALSSVPDPQPLFDEPPALSLFPEHGSGFFGQPALLGSRRGRDFATVFELEDLQKHENTLTLHLEDALAALTLKITLSINPASDVLTAHTALTNRGTEAYDVEWLAALTLSLPERFDEVMTLGGRWASEFHTDRYQIARPCQIERISRYGRTGHGSNPTLFIGEAGFGELAGEVTGLHLGWSGNHRVLVEVRRDGSRHAQLVRLDQAPFAHSPPVRLPGLDGTARYRLTLVEPWPQPAATYLANETAWRAQPVVDGEALMRIGLRLPLALPETAWLLHLERL